MPANLKREFFSLYVRDGRLDEIASSETDSESSRSAAKSIEDALFNKDHDLYIFHPKHEPLRNIQGLFTSSDPEMWKRISGTINDKVKNEWICETENGDVFTIYDWKEYRVYGDDEMIEWHIGGYSGKVTGQAQREIEILLNQHVL
jgi:hypothetical protein